MQQRQGGPPWGRLWQWTALPLAACLVLTLFIAAMQIDLAGSRSVVAGAQTGYILLDPGHGGADGGAQAADGTLEKDINLAIALPLRDMLSVCGYPVMMTRETDVSIHDPAVKTLREQKVSDMKNRLKLYEEASLAIGIHENKFEQTQYFGTQIFYSVNNAASLDLANAVRDSVIAHLQPENKRELKKGTKDIYLLHKTTVPAVLVECGFLSNPTERDKLKSAEYQRQMAFAIAGGILAYAQA